MEFRHAITIADIEVYPLRALGGVSPKMALGTMPSRPALLVRITDTEGCYGWGEVWANFPPRANIHKAHLIEDVVIEHLRGKSFIQPTEIEQALRHNLSIYFLHIGQLKVFEHILAGIDTALWDLALRSHGQTFAEFMELTSAQAQCYATSINAEDLSELIPRHSALGQQYFKLKIGFAEHGNREIVDQANQLCPKDARVMVDSNQSWTLDQAKQSLGALEDLSPYFAEEPLPANAAKSDWEALARSTSIPLAGGENIYGVDNFLEMTRAGMTVLQPDCAKWGGISGALALADAMPEGTLLWPHFMGTAIGQMAALSISASIGETSTCEIDVNENLLRTELCGSAITIKEGQVALPSSPGLIEPPLESELRNNADTIAIESQW